VINVDEVYQDCRRLLSKDKAGYFSNEEFNRFSIMAEQMLWRFYVKHFEEHGFFADSMIPFNKVSVRSMDANNRFTLPSDFGRRNILWRRKVTNAAGGLTISNTKIQYLEKEELQDTLDSAVRGPNLAKERFYWTFVNGGAQVYPTFTGPVELDYIRNPTYATRAVTDDPDNMEEVYDSANSTNYEWFENERANIVDLVLMQYGIVLRETDVVQFAQMQAANNQTIKQL
jgi:hypothetical protein